MAKQKAAYEEKLKSQETQNKAIVVQNANISAAIKKVQDQNTALRKQAKDLKKSNHLLRSAVHGLESKMGMGKEFAAKTLSVTDDSKQAVLAVLKTSKGKRTKTVLAQVSSKEDHDDD